MRLQSSQHINYSMYNETLFQWNNSTRYDTLCVSRGDNQVKCVDNLIFPNGGHEQNTVSTSIAWDMPLSN